MSGVRISHPTERSRLAVVVDISRPLDGGPVVCPRVDCGQVHEHKSYHLDLDDRGTVIVSETVFEALKRAQAVPGVFQVEAEVKQPPPLVISKGKTRAELDAENRSINVRGGR